MNIGISNIAWTTEVEADLFPMLKKFGVRGIEIAPTKIWPEWDGATVAATQRLRSRFEDQGFAIPSLQAILYGKPDLQVFGDQDSVRRLEEHICRVADIAVALGAKNLVFGAPRNRDPGCLDSKAAWERAVQVFKVLGGICYERGVKLCIEANPEAYGCQFITTFCDAAAFVHEVGSGGIGLHLDTGCAYMANEQLNDINQFSNNICHFHVSEPHLGSFEQPKVAHDNFGNMLKTVDYRGWVIIEMRSVENNELASIKRACEVTFRAYGS